MRAVLANIENELFDEFNKALELANSKRGYLDQPFTKKSVIKGAIVTFVNKYNSKKFKK